MDRRERYYDQEEILRTVMDAVKSRLWTALPGVIKAFNPVAMTVTVQPAINGLITDQKGILTGVQMPLLLDVPVFFPSGGGATFTFPIKNDDECLVVFTARCMDSWWSQGFVPPNAGKQFNPANNPLHRRTHNLSDGMAFVGFRSQPRAFTVDTVNVSLQADDGSSYLKYNPGAGSLNMNMPGGVTINGATITAAGEIIDALGKKLGTHTHNETGTVTLGPNTT